MEVQLQTPGGLRRELHVRIPAEEVASAVEDRLKDISRRARLPGFRPGKAPFKVIQQQYGTSARLEAVSELVEKSYPEAVTQSGVRPVGQPKIDITAEKPGEALEYVARFEVIPEVQLVGFDIFKIDKPIVEVTDADVDRLIANLRKSRRTQNKVDRLAQAGDIVKANFEGKLDGEAFPGGKGEGVDIEIGVRQFLPELEDGLIGHAAGETWSVPVTFPDDYRAEDLRGKTAQFELSALEVNEPQLPALDDAEFLKAHSVETAEALRGKARTALETERDKAIQNRRKVQVLDQLLAANPVEVPQALIDQEVPRIRDEAAGRMNLRKATPEQLEQMLPATLFEPAARKRVSLGLLIGELIRQREIKLDPQRVEQALERMAADYEQPDQVRQYYRSQPQMMQGLSAMVLEDQVVETILAEAGQEEVSLSLEQLLNPAPQPAVST